VSIYCFLFINMSMNFASISTVREEVLLNVMD